MSAAVHAQDLGVKLPPLKMTASQLAVHPQDLKTPPTMASDSHLGHSRGASLDHLLAHLESSKQALEHQVQQLLQENRLSKSAKKEQQWQMEGDRLHSKLDSLNGALMEKEERIHRLEKDLRDARGSIQQLQSRCREAEKGKESGALERANVQADLEDVRANFQGLEREYKAKHNVAEKQRQALESLSGKVEKQKESFQNQLEDARRRLVEAEEREQKHEMAAQLASQQMVEKGRQLKSLRDAHEKLLAVQKGKQAEERQEVREVIQVLESTHAKCEEQKALIKDLEQELSKVRKEAHQLDTRASVAEADARSKAAMLEKLQLELDNTSSSVEPLTRVHIEDLKAQVETLRRNLQDVESMLVEEGALRFKAECALKEFKLREKSLLKVEQDCKALQEEAKWRNEQFESLEEAHNRMRDQFHLGRDMWASERAAILRDIEVLTESVQSRDFVIHDLRSQLKLLQQSLTHEENCRKLLEFQLADAKAGMESVSAEFLSAQSILESLRENSKIELSFLKDTLTEKDKQLKELHDKQKQIDRDRKELCQLEAELDSYKSSCEHLQQALDNRAEQEMLATDFFGAQGNNAELDSDLQEERETLTRSLNDAETTIAAMEVEMKELEMELDRTRTLSELLRTSLAEAEEKHLEGKTNLEQVSASLSAKKQRVLELETELEKIRVVVDDVRECNTGAEARILLLEERLRDAQSELQAKNNLNLTLLNAHEHKEVVSAMRLDCEALQRQLNTCEIERFESEKHREKLIAESSDTKQMYQREQQELLTRLDHLAKQCIVKDTQLTDLLDQIEREKQVATTLEARCSASEQELSKQLSLVEHAREEVIVWKLNAQAYKERAQSLDASLNAEAAAKDTSLQEIKNSLHELTVLCKGGAQATTSQTLRISSIEEKLQRQDTLQGSVDGRLVTLLGELNVVMEEVERISQGVAHLNTELHGLEDDSKLTKTDFETRLRAVEGLFSSSCAELKEISQQVGKVNAERLSLVKSMNMKAGDLELLKGENQSLHDERSKLETDVNDLEEKLLKLAREAESSKAVIDALNENLKAAEVGMAIRSGELHELHERLEESESKSMHLLGAANQAQDLEDKLRETEAVVHDKDQRLAASEWTVQQLANEIAKSKSYLTQKEKDEVASKDRLSHLETQLRQKERELMELQCDLENAVKTSDKRHTVVQQLTCSTEELGVVLNLTKRALEERTETLAASEAEVKRLLEMQRLTEEALETCKDRLLNEVKTNVAREKDMNRLCEDMERTSQESKLAEVQVKDLQENLKCLEGTTAARLESYERKMEKGAVDFSEYKENCAGLLDLIEKKDAVIHELELVVDHGRKELANQVMLSKQGERELTLVSQSKTKMHIDLKAELATADGLVKEFEVQKRALEEELTQLKSSLAVATESLREKSLEIGEQKRSIERLESLIVQQGDAHVAKTKELQLISDGALEERDSKIANLQSALNKVHDDLRTAHEVVSTEEGAKRVLSVRLSEMESLVEKGKSQISQLQASLQVAGADLEAETERVWDQVAAKNDMEKELGAWKAKATALTKSSAEFEKLISRLQSEVKEWKEVAERAEKVGEMELDAWLARVAALSESNGSMRAEFERSLKKSQVEVEEWKEIAENTQFLNAELEKSMQAVQESVTGWEKVVTSLADEGDVTKRHVEFLLKQVHEEFRCLHADLVNVKDLVSITCREGSTLKAEFLTFVKDSQVQVETLREQAPLAIITCTEEREHHLQAIISNLQRELNIWETNAMHLPASEASLQEAQSELKDWRQRADEWESFNGILKQAFLDFEHALLECKSDVASVDGLGKDMKLDIQRSFQNLREEVVKANTEILELKEVAALETKRVQLECEDCVATLQAEVEVWKEKTAAAAEEGLQMKAQFEELLQSLQGELKIWKQFETLAREERRFIKPETTTNVVVSLVGLGDEVDVLTPNSINPFHQEDEGCSSGLEAPDTDDAPAQLHGWKSKSSTVAREGRKLTRQFRASFKHVQFELESRKQAPRLTKHESFVRRRDDTGIEDLVKALQEEAVEIKAELADRKNKANSAAQETATLTEDLERTIRKLKAEVEGWKDRSAMSAGQRIVAKRQLDDYAKQVRSLNTELQKWKDVATEANEGSTKLQSSLESVQKENEEGRSELNEWMQKALELNCRVKDLEADLEKWKQRAGIHNDGDRLRLEELEHLRTEVEKWKIVAAAAEEEGKSAKVELLDTLGKFEDELEVMSSNSIGECSSAGGRSLREEELDCSAWQRSPSGRFSNEWRHVASELETPLQAEVEDWKKGVVCGEKEQKELQAELEIWKARAGEAAEDLASLGDAHGNAIKELQLELTQWKAKSETASEEAKSVKANLENVVQDLENQVHMWKQKAENALEGVKKSQEYDDLIKALEEELCLWTQRTEEGKFLQLQLEIERTHLKESLGATQNELQEWKDKAAVLTTSIRSLQEGDVNTELEVRLQKWRSKANDGELLQLQLKELLAETQTELQEWKHKAAEFSLAAEFLKEELDCIIEEGRLEKEELDRSTGELETELCIRAQKCQSLQTQLESSRAQVQIWEERAAVITQSTKSSMEEFDLTVEGGIVERQEFINSISALKASVRVWKDKAAESESIQLELKSTLLETQTELQGWKDRAAAVAVATKSLKGDIDCILDDNRVQKEKLCNTINALEAELVEWKSRAQEGVSVQRQLERTLSEMEDKAAAAASETQALKNELDSTITETSSDIQQLCTTITKLEAELSELKGKTDDGHSPQLLQLQSLLTETQSQLREWQDKATVASQAEEELREAVEEIRSQTQKLHHFIAALRGELLEWKTKAKQLETSQLELTSALASSQEELQSWKQTATDSASVTDLDLRNSVDYLETELSQWKEKAQEGELLHQQMRNSLTETQLELQDMKEKIAAFASSTDSLKDELSSANELARTLTTRLHTQKHHEVTLQKLNHKLEADLALVREEALSRKQKMIHIMTQLEGTSNSQKELQSKLHLAQHRLLGNENHRRQAEIDKAAAKAFPVGSDSIYSPGTPDPFRDSRSQHQRSQSESPDFKLDVSRASVKNPAVDQMRQELSSMKTLVSKLEHVRGSDGEQSQAFSVGGDGEKIATMKDAWILHQLPRESEELNMDVDGAQRRDVPLQKQVESSSANQELVHLQQKRIDRSRSLNVTRFKVLADVDGNAPRAPANHDKLQPEGVCPPGTPNNVPFSRLRRTASGV